MKAQKLNLTMILGIMLIVFLSCESKSSDEELTNRLATIENVEKSEKQIAVMSKEVRGKALDYASKYGEVFTVNKVKTNLVPIENRRTIFFREAKLKNSEGKEIWVFQVFIEIPNYSSDVCRYPLQEEDEGKKIKAVIGEDFDGIRQLYIFDKVYN